MAEVNKASGFRRTTNTPLDVLYLKSDGTAFATTAEANAAIPSGVRHIGEFVVLTGGLYWYFPGTSNSDLIKFTPFGPNDDLLCRAMSAREYRMSSLGISTVNIDTPGQSLSLTTAHLSLLNVNATATGGDLYDIEVATSDSTHIFVRNIGTQSFNIRNNSELQMPDDEDFEVKPGHLVCLVGTNSNRALLGGSGSGGAITVDSTPVDSSSNPISSDWAYGAQQGIDAINALLGDVGGDEDSAVNKLREALVILQNFSEGADVAALLNAKLNASDVSDNLTGMSTTKVLSEAQGKVLKDLIDDLYNSFVTNSDVITAITAANYNSGNQFTAALTPANGAVLKKGKFYKAGHRFYVATADNVCYRFPSGEDIAGLQAQINAIQTDSVTLKIYKASNFR